MLRKQDADICARMERRQTRSFETGMSRRHRPCRLMTVSAALLVHRPAGARKERGVLQIDDATTFRS